MLPGDVRTPRYSPAEPEGTFTDPPLKVRAAIPGQFIEQLYRCKPVQVSKCTVHCQSR